MIAANIAKNYKKSYNDHAETKKVQLQIELFLTNYFHWIIYFLSGSRSVTGWSR